MDKSIFVMIFSLEFSTNSQEYMFVKTAVLVQNDKINFNTGMLFWARKSRAYRDEPVPRFAQTL